MYFVVDVSGLTIQTCFPWLGIDSRCCTRKFLEEFKNSFLDRLPGFGTRVWAVFNLWAAFFSGIFIFLVCTVSRVFSCTSTVVVVAASVIKGFGSIDIVFPIVIYVTLFVVIVGIIVVIIVGLLSSVFLSGVLFCSSRSICPLLFRDFFLKNGLELSTKRGRLHQRAFVLANVPQSFSPRFLQFQN